MKVQIEGDMYLESDSMQFIIKEYTGRISKDKETGKETEHYNTHGYFSSMEGALRHFLKMKLMQSTAAHLNELLREFRQLDQWIHAQLQSESA